MNQVKEFKNYYISYNPSPVWGGEEGQETALCLKGVKTKFYILLGDFRKQYAKCKSLKECLAFFKKMSPTHKGSWSN